MEKTNQTINTEEKIVVKRIEHKKTIIGTLSAVFGILGLVLGFNTFFPLCYIIPEFFLGILAVSGNLALVVGIFYSGIPFSIAGLIMGIVGKNKKIDSLQKKLFLTGIITGAIGLFFTISMIIIFIIVM